MQCLSTVPSTEHLADSLPLMHYLDRAAVATVPAMPGSSLLRTALDALGLGLLLVDAAGRALLANRAARALCQPGSLMGLAGPQLSLRPADQDRLAVALRAAQRGLRSMLVLRQGRQCLSVGVLPMQDGDHPHLVAMLVMGPSASMRGLALQFFSQAHQLTMAESAVLAALCDGQRPAEVAASAGVAVCTVRSQITAIRSKTQSASIGHLMQQVSGLPPIAPKSLADHCQT